MDSPQLLPPGRVGRSTCTIEVPSGGFSLHIACCTLDPPARDAGLHLDDPILMRLELPNPAKRLALDLARRGANQLAIGVDLRALEWLGELHGEINLPALRPDVWAAPTHDCVFPYHFKRSPSDRRSRRSIPIDAVTHSVS